MFGSFRNSAETSGPTK